MAIDMEKLYHSPAEAQETSLNSLKLKSKLKVSMAMCVCHNEGWHSATDLQWDQN